MDRGANGDLTVYAGGLDKKKKLLKIEKVDTNNLKHKLLDWRLL